MLRAIVSALTESKERKDSQYNYHSANDVYDIVHEVTSYEIKS